MKTVFCKAVKKTGKIAVFPLVWLIKKQAEGYEKMFGDNLKYVNFWM